MFCLCMIFSCNNGDKTAEEKTIVSDSVQTINSIAAEDSTMIFENNIDNWLTESLHNPTLNWQKFQLQEFWYEDSLKQLPLHESAQFYKEYAPVLKWSPDSSYVLDMGSVGTTIITDKKGNTKVADGDIDTQVSLLLPKQKKKEQLLFFGSNTSLIDARWIDSTQIAVFGAFTEKPNQPADTLLWIIDAKNNYFRKYKWQ